MNSGHIGLATFSYIVRDARLKDIPLILETPGFDRTEVWSKEIEMLNEIGLAPDDGLKTEEEQAEMVKSLKGIVKTCEAESGKKGKVKAVAKPKKGGKRKTEDSDDEDDE